MGVLLVVRHRTVRLMGAFALALVALMLATGGRDSAAAESTVLLIAGSMAVVGASRVLAPGAALSGARRAAGRWWLHPVGRLVGVLLVSGGVALVAVAALRTEWLGGVQLAAVAAIYAAALGAVVLGLTPLIGASAAGGLGLLAVWLGAIPPSTVSVMLGDWWFLQRPIVLLWNSLPLSWRVLQWLTGGVRVDVALFVGWLGVGIALAGWAGTRWQQGGAGAETGSS